MAHSSWRRLFLFFALCILTARYTEWSLLPLFPGYLWNYLGLKTWEILILFSSAYGLLADRGHIFWSWKEQEYSFKCTCRFCILKPYFPICQFFTCKTCSKALPFCSPFLLPIQTATIQGQGLYLFDIFVYHLVQWSPSDQEYHKQSGQTGNDMPVWTAVCVEEHAGRVLKPCQFDQGAMAFTQQKVTACLSSTPTTTDTAAQTELWGKLAATQASAAGCALLLGTLMALRDMG